MLYKIIGDSCMDLTEELKLDPHFQMIPLTLQIGDYKVTDDETFNQADFLQKVAACPECPKSACPSPESYRKAFDCEAEHIYCVTLSSELSGSYNSAVLGANLAQEEDEDLKIHVFNSRSASIGETLIVKKITSSATSTTKQTVYLIFLFELIHVGKFIRILRGQHLMKIMDNASGIHGILIKVFPDTPYVSVFDCLKICKKTVFCQ